ncbi:MAG: 1-acyl-sn-glycerol-3-phosphate acyltransferase [Bacteroidales bacterium]|nr:1-acyl-sn-glycerol-3-phosphate acyltransferase [Bacteroidales bacterium]
MDLTEFNDIAPFNDEETAAALTRLASHRNVPWISRFIFPDKPETFLAEVMRSIKTVDEFQATIMSKAVEWVIQTTIKEFTCNGLENIQQLGSKFLAMSNHRDIILDPAIMQLVLLKAGIPETQICVGDNLLKSKSVELLIRSNRMIKVIRGISARELYLSSQLLSRYIRETITSGTSSVWIAQRQGRTKDGLDTTEQGLLKMVDMSGTGDFEQNFREVHIVPLSISYEYEPCDILKAREVLISRTQKYVKGENEDLQSIVQGIKQYKGCVHLEIGEPLSEAEIHAAAECDKNDRYQHIRHTLDQRIIRGYKLWKTHYMAYDLVEHTDKYSAQYTPEELEAFKAYVDKQLATVEPTLDQNELRDIFLHIYSNPVLAKEQLQNV